MDPLKEDGTAEQGPRDLQSCSGNGNGNGGCSVALAMVVGALYLRSVATEQSSPEQSRAG